LEGRLAKLSGGAGRTSLPSEMTHYQSFRKVAAGMGRRKTLARIACDCRIARSVLDCASPSAFAARRRLTLCS